MKQKTHLNGLILAGGNSSRMGHDKSEIQYYGKPQYQVLHNLLIHHCDNVFLSKRKDQTKPTSIPIIVDQFEINSPLNGILSAFNNNPLNAWITVPCDMPLIDNAILLFLIENRNTDQVATCFWDSDKKFPEPLFTLWEQKAGPLLMEFYNSGGVSPRKFLLQNDINLILAPDRNKLFNINTPEELAQLISTLRKG